MKRNSASGAIRGDPGRVSRRLSRRLLTARSTDSEFDTTVSTAVLGSIECSIRAFIDLFGIVARLECCVSNADNAPETRSMVLSSTVSHVSSSSPLLSDRSRQCFKRCREKAS